MNSINFYEKKTTTPLSREKYKKAVLLYAADRKALSRTTDIEHAMDLAEYLECELEILTPFCYE